MSVGSPPRSSYDRIAHLYDVDMARNMPFDDVGFYVGVSKSSGGRTLELGCGNGRILLELLARGIDAWGIDHSARMLEALRGKAAVRGLPLRVCQMDARALGLACGFDVVLCPYSLVTYMAASEDVARMLGESRRVLKPHGALVVDAFVPRPVTDTEEFRADYRREYDGGVLARSKRVRPIAPRINRIERRYEVLSVDGRVQERIDTAEDIQPFEPAQLVDALHDAGFVVESRWWNYSSPEPIDEAQFFTVVSRKDAR